MADTKITYPVIPQATDLKSCIAAVNALALAFRILAQIGPGSKTDTSKT